MMINKLKNNMRDLVRPFRRHPGASSFLLSYAFLVIMIGVLLIEVRDRNQSIHRLMSAIDNHVYAHEELDTLGVLGWCTTYKNLADDVEP